MLLNVHTKVQAQQTHVADLCSLDEDVRIVAARSIKNAVIGSRLNKSAYISHGVVPKLVDILTADSDEELVVQATAAVGSLATGCEENARAVVQSGALPPLIALLSHSSARVVEAASRSTKMLFQSSITPRCTVFEENTLRTFMNLLSHPNDNVVESIASVIARSCDGASDAEHQAILASGGVESLIGLLFNTFGKNQEASLDALASLSGNSERVRTAVLNRVGVLAKLLRLIHDKRPRVRLLSATCVANLCRSDWFPDSHKEMASIVPVVVKLLSEADMRVREEAPLVLDKILCDNKDLQQVAAETDAISKLSAFISNPHSTNRLKQTSLQALAGLCSMREESRKIVIEDPVLPVIVSLLSSPNSAVRAAACRCVRSLSRSVKNLRTHLFDAGTALPLLKLLNDSSVEVQTTASAALCNIVLDFSPMRKIFLEHGGIPALVQLTRSMYQVLRLNALWALKNLTFLADWSTKEAVLSELTFPALLQLVCDQDPAIQEQALTLMRNLAYKDVENFVKGTGINCLVDMIIKMLHSPRTEAITQVLYVICNIATGNSEHKSALLIPPILQRMHELLGHNQATVRVATIWCIINLTWQSDLSAVAKLKDLGFDRKLQALVNDPDIDVTDRAKACLEQFCSPAQPAEPY